jgi:hypothetical protein
MEIIVLICLPQLLLIFAFQL